MQKSRGKDRHKLKNKDLVQKTATCSICGLVKINLRRDKNGHLNRPECAIAHALDVSGSISGKIKNLPPNVERVGECEICKIYTERVIDHCHISSSYRGMLCSHCNKMLGMARDNKEVLANAIRYLDR